MRSGTEGEEVPLEDPFPGLVGGGMGMGLAWEWTVVREDQRNCRSTLGRRERSEEGVRKETRRIPALQEIDELDELLEVEGVAAVRVDLAVQSQDLLLRSRDVHRLHQLQHLRFRESSALVRIRLVPLGFQIALADCRVLSSASDLAEDLLDADVPSVEDLRRRGDQVQRAVVAIEQRKGVPSSCTKGLSMSGEVRSHLPVLDSGHRFKIH